MSRYLSILYYFATLTIAILLQVFVLNHVHIDGYFSPLFYIVFILVLPYELPNWLLLASGFLLGLIIDIFAFTPGLHATATLALAYMRILTINRISPKGEYEGGTLLSATNYGWVWYLKYISILISTHHFILYFLESFTFQHADHTIFKALSSILATGLLLLLTQLSKK